MKLYRNAIAFTIFVIMPATVISNPWSKDIELLKRSVVNIKNVVQIGLETEDRGTAFGTGFVVDAVTGLIATNQHVVGIGPSTNEVTFYSGEIADAKIIYTDPVHDMAFLKVEASQIRTPLSQVTLGSAFSLAPGDPVLMIGNNQVEEYSIKTGEVSNLYANKGYLYSSYIHSSFDRAGGSSGSPVWNIKKEVVGIHAAGTETSSFELYIDYLRDALDQINRGEHPKRGYIGIDVELTSFGEAERYYKMPAQILQGKKPKSKDARIVRKLPLIAYLLPATSGAKMLEVGDIIWSVNGREIFDNLYLLDRILNEHVGSKVTVQVFRNGAQLEQQLEIENLESARINEFIRFAGATFHKITPFLKRDFGIMDDGIFMNYAQEGSPFDSIARRNTKGNYQLVIRRFDGIETPGVSDLLGILRNREDNPHTFAVIRDYGTYNTNTTSTKVTLTSRFGPLEHFRRDPKSHQWIKEELTN